MDNTQENNMIDSIPEPSFQHELIFFVGKENAPSKEVRAWMVNPANSNCPFSKYVGNTPAVRRLCKAAFSALGKPNHVCNTQNFALLGPASTGKTTLAKHFANLIGLPFVEISPMSVKDLSDLFQKISNVLSGIKVGEDSLELVDIDGKFILPPMVIFIDEVHAVKNAVIQGLLTATEKSDGIMDTGDHRIDCRNVCWIIATTDRGLLFDAFDTRFTKIDLKLYTTEEITKIIQLSNPDWTIEVCKLVAMYGGRIPREAKAFAEEMRLSQEMTGGDWKSIADQVAHDNGIDKFGMHFKRLLVLKTLANGPIAQKRLPQSVGVKIEELEKFILPLMMSHTSDQSALINVSSKGYELTAAGYAELDRRDIPYVKEK